MSQAPSDASGSDPVFFDFQRGFEAAADPAAFLEQMCTRHPERAQEFRDYAQVMGLVRDAGGPAAEAIPEALGEFRLKRRIGRGMSEVYEAWQPSLRRRVAVKVVRQGRTSPAARDRFEREQRVLAKLHQTHIVPIHAAGEEGPIQYFVMPYIDGASLHHVVHTTRSLGTRQGGSTPPLSKLAELTASLQGRPTVSPSAAGKEPDSHVPNESVDERVTERPRLSMEYYRSVAEVMADAAEALEYAHQEKVLHRDLKPANIMVDRDGHCWLIDFGLAEDGHGGTNGAAAEGPRHGPWTVSGVMGTPPYMAPEQWDGKADRRTDVYGLGVTLYELLTLQPAFQDGSNEEVKRRVLSETPPPARAVMPGVPRDLEAICQKAMHQEWGRRYGTSGEVAADLRRWLGGQETKARPAWFGRRMWMWARREPWRAAMSVLVLVLLVGVGVGGAAWQVLEERKRTRQQEYERSLLQVRHLRQPGRVAGWSGEAFEAGKIAARSGATERLRSQVAATLLGLDAETIKHGVGAASTLAFDKTGKLLLRGGVESPLLLAGKRPAHLLDLASDRTTTYKQTGEGPVLFLADGTPAQLLASDGKWPLRLVDLPADRTVRELAPPEKERLTLQGWDLSTDGRLAASVQGAAGKETSIVHLWDLNTGKLLKTLEQAKVTSLALSPDGAELAVGRDDGGISLWSGKWERPLEWSSGRLRVTALAFGRDPHQTRTGRPWLLASGNTGGSVTAWEAATWQARSRCYGAHFEILGLAFSPDGMTLASGGRRPCLLWDLATGQLALSLRASPDYAASLAFSPDGNTLAASSLAAIHGGPSHYVWALKQKREMTHLRGVTAQMAKVRLSQNGKRLAALAQNWDIGVWDLESCRLLHVLSAPRGILADNADIDFSPDGNELAFCAGTEARRWDVKTGAVTGSWKMPPGMADRLLFEEKTAALIVCRMETRDGKVFPVLGAHPKPHPRVIRFYELKAKGERVKIAENGDFSLHVHDQKASPEGQCFVLIGANYPQEEKTLKVFSARGKELWTARESLKNAAGFVIDPGGAVLGVGFPGDPSLTLVDLASGRVVGTSPTGANVIGPGAEPRLEFSNGPRGEWLGVNLYRQRGDKEPALALGIDHSLSGESRFNRAGTRVAWGNEDGTVVVCDLPAVQRRLAGIGLGW